MIAAGRACDVCDKFVRDAEETPADWFIVTRGGTDSEVCSPACLCKLGTQLKTMEKAPIPAGGHKPTVKCPICKKPCKGQQGLTMHMTKTHPDGQG